MKKKIYIPLAIVFLLFSLLVVTTGLYLTNALPEKLTYTIDHFIAGFKNGTPQDTQRASSPEIIFDGAKGALMPKDSYAVTVDLGKDLSTPADGSASYGALVQETETFFNDFKNYKADTVYITPDYSGKYDQFTDAYGNRVDVLRDYIKYSDAAGLFKVLVLTDAAVAQDGQLTFEKASYYLKNYGFNAVLFSAKSYMETDRFKDAVQYFSRNVKEQFQDVRFGAVLPSSAQARFASQATLSVLQSDLIDFALIEGAAMKDPSLPFASVMSAWNTLAQQFPNVTFYCLHRNDLVCTDTAAWSNYLEISDQVRYLWECENFYGSVFCSASALLMNKNTSSLRLSYLLYDGAYDDLAVSGINVNSEAGTVMFTGKGAAGRKILCNRVSLGSSGSFTHSAKLQAGENTFSFFSCGKDLTYRIYNNTEFIRSCYPAEDVTVADGETLYITAVCLEGASVTCTLNGVSYDMLKSYTLEATDIPEGYHMFSCGVKLNGDPEKDVDFGSVVISAVYNETTETVTAGAVTVKSGQGSGLLNNIGNMFSGKEPDAQTEQTVSYSGVTPYRDNGLGKALICRIIDDNTEQLGALGEKDTYHADASTLPAGTIDYLDSMELSDTGYLRYKLKSGLTVYGVNCELISNGYALPQNRIAVNHVDDSSERFTNIVFDADWFSPITVKCKPQRYSGGYSGYSYNISSFTAEYVEVKFHYTGEFYNSALLQFAQNSVFSTAELYKEGENNLLLRLYLKKPGQYYGFRIFRNEIGQIVVSFKKHSTGFLQNKVIMLDPGHGGLSMTGTANADTSIPEKTVTLAIAKKAKEMLESKGATVLMTRIMDTPVTLESRGILLCENDPDIFVSIHCDGTETETDAGTHSFYFRPYSQPLANAINTSLAAMYKTHIYSPADDNYAKVDKSIKFYPFFVTRMDNCPSVLVETGFMTNHVEGQILTEDNAQYWLAKGIADGIEQYFAANN